MCVQLFCFGVLLDFSVQLEADKHCLVFDILAYERSVDDHTALDKSLETDELAELALKVELVALFGYEIDVALAGIYQIKEFVYVYIAE